MLLAAIETAPLAVTRTERVERLPRYARRALGFGAARRAADSHSALQQSGSQRTHFSARPGTSRSDACARGTLEVSRSGGRASATRLFHAYPLRLICPRRAGVERASGADCVWCYQVSFGGGLVAGSATLLGGDPGIGKSTLLLQAAASMARKDLRTVYISGEEALAQLRMRAARLKLTQAPVELAAETNIEIRAPVLFSLARRKA